MSVALRQQVGHAGAALVERGMLVGLGTGSTAAHAIRRLGERVRLEGLQVRGIPTSLASEELARACGIPLLALEPGLRPDITLDGADEVDPGLNLIKGGGGALLREKVVASRSRRLVILVDPGKLVARLGLAFRLPVEVVPFARHPVADAIASLGGDAGLRSRQGGEPFVTDNGNWILDVRFPGGIVDPAGMETRLDAIPGVVETGLFVGLASQVLVGTEGGVESREASAASPARATHPPAR